MRAALIWFSAMAMGLFLGSCGDDSSRSGSNGDGGKDTDLDGGEDGSVDTDTGLAIPDGPPGNLYGTVMAPSGTFPIPGALVYLTVENGSEIPDHAFCYECEDMTGKEEGVTWTLSNPDGSWELENVPSGTWNIVTRKGFFQVHPDPAVFQ